MNKSYKFTIAGFLAIALTLGSSTVARADWSQVFTEQAGDNSFNQILITSDSSGTFAPRGLGAFSQGTWAPVVTGVDGKTVTASLASGGPVNYSDFTVFFAGDSSAPVNLLIEVLNGTTVVCSSQADWNGGNWSLTPTPGSGGAVTAVPEPSTCIAGALLLLPFGFSAIRILRKNR